MILLLVVVVVELVLQELLKVIPFSLFEELIMNQKVFLVK
jgi:hypothetical protein